MATRPSRVRGIWCRSDKTFYHLECGQIVSVRSPIDRLRNLLVARGTIEYSLNGVRLMEEPYLLMSMQEAIDKNYDVTRIFLNRHVQAMVEASEAKTQTVSPWAKSNTETSS